MRFLFPILFWVIYFPILRLATLLLFWNSKVEERERFEKRNKFEYLAHSFKEWNETADLCFEFSSEGEYQQVAPLIDDALKSGLKIELVFFSPSVEKAIMKLASKYSTQVRYLRFPLVRLFPGLPRRSFSSWVTAKTLIMVRYDLLPEIYLWSLKKDRELRMIWMTFKKERSKGKSASFWKKLFLKRATKIVFAGESDEREGSALGLEGLVFDFRIEQIKRRIALREEKLKNMFPLYQDFKLHISQEEKKVILGNAWPSDLSLLRDLPPDYLLVVVPHQLSADMISLFKEGLEALGREVFEINNFSTVYTQNKTILLNKKGILCELYSDFSHSYVGGGFEGSIHSVLEPLVANSQSLACGPRHERSTEFDIALAMGRIAEVNTPEEFLSWLKEVPKNEEHAKMDKLIEGYESLREYVTSC